MFISPDLTTAHWDRWRMLTFQGSSIAMEESKVIRVGKLGDYGTVQKLDTKSRSLVTVVHYENNE